MSDFETGAAVAENQEVAAPEEILTETGAEEPEVAAPESEEHQKTKADAAFAEMRRKMEAAQKEAEDVRAELAELQAQNEARQSAYSRLTGKGEDADITALAEVTGMSEDEIRAEMEAAQESAQKDLRIQQLEEQVDAARAEQLMQADLAELRKIDPSLKSLEDLGPSYMSYMEAGLSPEDAYWAIKSKEKANQKTPPQPPGTVATGTVEKDRYTDAEIEAMSPDQRRKNWKAIYNSWG